VRIETPAAPATDKRHTDLKKAAQQFEGYFLNAMLKEMRKTVPEDKLLGDDGHGQEIFRDMMDQTISESMSKRGDFGIAKMMYDQLASTLGDAPGTAKTAGSPLAPNTGGTGKETSTLPSLGAETAKTSTDPKG